MKLCYVAGPYTAPTRLGVRHNVVRARGFAQDIWRLGHACLCPHSNTEDMDAAAPYETFIAGSLLMVERCDAVLLIGDWRQSKGAMAERAHAQAKGIPVFETMDGLKAWLKGGE